MNRIEQAYINGFVKAAGIKDMALKIPRELARVAKEYSNVPQNKGLVEGIGENLGKSMPNVASPIEKTINNLASRDGLLPRAVGGMAKHPIATTGVLVGGLGVNDMLNSAVNQPTPVPLPDPSQAPVPGVEEKLKALTEKLQGNVKSNPWAWGAGLGAAGILGGAGLAAHQHNKHKHNSQHEPAPIAALS